MIGIPKLLPSYAGFIVRDEVAHLSEALNPAHPALAIIGGAKFETKDPVIRTFLARYDHVCVVGAIANDVLRKVTLSGARVSPSTRRNKTSLRIRNSSVLWMSPSSVLICSRA